MQEPKKEQNPEPKLRVVVQRQGAAEGDGSGGFAFVQVCEGSLGLLQEEEAEEGHDQTGHAQDLEEGAVGSRDHLGVGSPPPPIHIGRRLKMVR